MYKSKSANHSTWGKKVTCNTYRKRGIAATQYPTNMICFRYVNVNTLHEADNKLLLLIYLIMMLLNMLFFYPISYSEAPSPKYDKDCKS
jgi:hypothetical protein